MKIGAVAREAGVTIDTVRFYERRGVLPEPDRRPSGYREYSGDTVERIRLARRLQAVGLTLDEIVEALAAHDAGAGTCATERWRLDAALARVDRTMAELAALRAHITTTREACAAGCCTLLTVADPGS